LPNRLLDIPQYARRLKILVLTQGFQQTGFAEFFSSVPGCLGNAIGIDTQEVSGFQLNFGDGAIDALKQAKDGGGRVQLFHRASLAEQ
jgi:hypothetical protein